MRLVMFVQEVIDSEESPAFMIIRALFRRFAFCILPRRSRSAIVATKLQVTDYLVTVIGNSTILIESLHQSACVEKRVNLLQFLMILGIDCFAYGCCGSHDWKLLLHRGPFCTGFVFAGQGFAVPVMFWTTSPNHRPGLFGHECCDEFKFLRMQKQRHH